MLGVDEVLSLGRVPPRIRPSKFVEAVNQRSEKTMRNWLTNPPRPPQREFEESEKLLAVLEAEDPGFRMPVSRTAGQQLSQMRVNMDEGEDGYRANRLSFERIYDIDMERWPDVAGKQKAFEKWDWDVVLCCFYYQLNLAHCEDESKPGKWLEDAELWDALTEKLVQMTDTGVREAGTAREEALHRLIKVSLLWRRIAPVWNRLSRKEKTAADARVSDEKIRTQTRNHIARYALFEETIILSKELPDFAPSVFNAIAAASGLGQGDRYGRLWTCLQRADERFDGEWFKTAFHNRGRRRRRAQAVFAAKFERVVDEDFQDFVLWLDER